MRNYLSWDWLDSPALSVVLAEVLAVCTMAYKGGWVMVVLRGIVDPGLAFWEQLDFCNMGLVAGMMMLDIVADVGVVGGLFIKGAVLLMVFLFLREDDFLSWLFRFHRGVRMTLTIRRFFHL